jgi:hypothetical protein
MALDIFFNFNHSRQAKHARSFCFQPLNKQLTLSKFKAMESLLHLQSCGFIKLQKQTKLRGFST